MMEDYQTTEHVKEEVVDCGFVEVSQDEHQLCTACLCATRTTRTLDDDALQQYYMHILTEMQPEGGVVLQSPRVCWECLSQLKRSMRFREQVQDSYRLLQPTLSMCDKEDLEEFLQTSVRRPGRLKTCFTHSIDISPQNETVATSDEETFETSLDNNIVVCVPEDKPPLMSHYQGHDIKKELSEETDAHTRTEVRNDIKTINTPNSTHESTGDVNTTLVCDYCYKRFTSKAALERHISTYNIYPHNNKTVPSPCEDCAVVLCSDDQCSECPDKHNLLQHNNMKTNMSQVLYQCKICHKSFSFKGNLLRHKRLHTGEKTFQCEVCHKSFTQKHHMLGHLRIHTGEKPFQCGVCHKSFTYKHRMLEHLRIHTGEKSFQCKVCHKSFTQKRYMLQHLRIHTGEKLYQCKVCHKPYLQKSSLANHIRLHTGEKPFQCTVCHKRFSVKSSLAYHIRIHTGEKPFQCDVCNKSFSRKSHFRRHLKTHTGEKPFQCEECHKSFSGKSYLVKHFRLHTGEKPFQCEVCHKSFTRKPNLIRHLRTHTRQ